MSLKVMTGELYQRAKRVAPYFASEFGRIEVPSGSEWVTAWDIAVLAVTWEYHLSNGARIDPRMVDGTLNRETGAIVDLHPGEVQDLIAVFDRVRQNEEVRRDLRFLVRGSH